MSRFAPTQHWLPIQLPQPSLPSYHHFIGMEELRNPPSNLSSLLRQAAHQRLAATGCLVLALFLLCAIFAPWLAPHDPAQLNLTARLLPPSAAHWFGTDELGRDVLSRTLYGARVSLLVAVAVVGISLALGSILGMLAGFYGGFTDTVVNIYLTNAFLALPGILLAVAIVAFLGPSLANLILALALAGWVNYARLVRAQVLTVKQREYVQAARSMGASDLHLMVRHILPNILQPLLVQASSAWLQPFSPKPPSASSASASSLPRPPGAPCSTTRAPTSSNPLT